MRWNLNHKGIRVNKTNNKTRLLERVRNMFLLVLAGVGCLPLAAQSLRDTNSAPDTFSVNSGYFSPDLANNMDYAQFLVDEARLEERLALFTRLCEGLRTELSVCADMRAVSYTHLTLPTKA